MRSKILAKLVEKFPGLSKEFLGLLSIQLEKKVTEESQIEGVLTGLDSLPISVSDLAAEFQKEGDKRVTAAQKKWKEENPDKPDPKPDPKPNPDPKPGDANAELLKEIREMRQEMTTLKTQQLQKTLSEQLTAKLKEKKIPLHLAKGRTVEKAEDLDTVFGEIEADYNEIKQGFVDEGLSGSSNPNRAEGGPVNTSNIDKDIADWGKKTNPVKETAKA